MDPKQLETQMKSFQAQLTTFKTQNEAMRRDFAEKLQKSQAEIEVQKALVRKKDEELKQFKEQSEKDAIERQKQIKEIRKREIAEFVENAKKSGRILPAQEEFVVKLMESMTSEETVAEFKEKDGSKKSHSQISLFKALINSIPKKNIFSELSVTPSQEDSSPDGGDGGDEAEVVSFQEVMISGKKENLPVEGVALDQKAREYMAANKGVSYADALCAVTSGKAKAELRA